MHLVTTPTVTSGAARSPHARDAIDARLLDDWQRDLPLVSRPFAVLADALGVSEAAVIDRLVHLHEEGVIARVGGVVRPNTIGVSTLAALAAPELRIDEIADLLSGIEGINHVYLRENALNIWFVATGPDQAHVAGALKQVAARSGLKVLDLRLEQAFHIDLGFKLSDRQERGCPGGFGAEIVADTKIDLTDRVVAQGLTDGLPLVARPFAVMADDIGISEKDVLCRIAGLIAKGLVPRVGIIVRHRALGWRSNAMVVWDVPDDDVASSGTILASVPGVNLCYRRTRYPREWAYNLYCMVHAKSRDEAFQTIAAASEKAGLGVYPRQILFSQRCFKQTGALVARRGGE